jgi:hypothetical protein
MNSSGTTSNERVCLKAIRCLGSPSQAFVLYHHVLRLFSEDDAAFDALLKSLWK